MKIIATVFSGYEAEWRIRIAPRKRKNFERSELITFWNPSDSSDSESMLIYNPTISINVKNRYDSQLSAIIPVNMAYALEDALNVMYENLQTKGLYTKDGNILYIDPKVADKCAVKIPCFTGSIILYPAKIQTKSGEEIRAARVVSDGKVIADMRHEELRELCELINHLDIQTFSLIASLLEKIDNMDKKLDRIMEAQATILDLLHRQGLNQVREQKQMSNGPQLDWKPIMEGF